MKHFLPDQEESVSYVMGWLKNMRAKIHIKRILRIGAWIGGSMVFFLALLWAGFFVWGKIYVHHITVNVEQMLLADAVRVDTSGGATPRETYDLFLMALREGDRDAAANYFTSDQQQAWRLYLTRIANAGLLDAMITDLENSEEDEPLNADHFRLVNGQWKIVSL